MKHSLCLTTTHLPMDEGMLAAPVVVATITCDKRLLKGAQPTAILTNIAARLGLLTFAIIDGDTPNLPGYQLQLFAEDR